MIDHVLRALGAPVVALGKMDERVFWVYLAGALALAIGVWTIKLRGRRTLARFLFPPEIWLHSSALFDLRWMVVRALLTSSLLGPLVIAEERLAVRVSSHFVALLGSGPLSQTIPMLAIVAITCGAFIGEDFARYWVHRMVHVVPAFWQLHQVHHSARVLTPFTIYRTHPLEGIVMQGGAALGLGVSVGTLAWLFGVKISVWGIGGVQGLSFLWNLLGSNLRHSHVWLAYPNWLARLMISPAAHQIHHSSERRHFDKNFGSVFSFWDRVFGTSYIPGGREELKFGVPISELNHEEHILSALFSPMLAALRPSRRWRAPADTD